MEFQFILVEKNDGIGCITLHDPKKRNAFSPMMGAELARCLGKMRFDPTIKALVIRGSEGNFCGGGDVAAMAARAENTKKGIPPAEDPRLNMARLNSIITTIREMDKPVIACLEGAVAGAGLSLAMACDFSIACESCKMLFAFINIALVPDMGSTMLLTRRVGMPRATELFMTGKPFNGVQAADWGIITCAVPAEELEKTVQKLACKLAAGPSMAYSKIKTLVNRSSYPGLADSMLMELEYQNQLNRSEDHMEAVLAFMEKRPPRFKGR